MSLVQFRSLDVFSLLLSLLFLININGSFGLDQLQFSSLDSPLPFPSPAPSPAPLTPDAKNSTILEYMDPASPPLLDGNPKCSIVVLQQVFAHTVGAPPAFANYSPPAGCVAPWSKVVLELSAVVSDRQKDRIAAVWLGGAELLRTTTPLAMSSGVFWRVRKDLTRYTALLRKGSIFSMILENSVDDLPGVFAVNVSFLFYRGAISGKDIKGAKLSSIVSAYPNIRGLYQRPADMIIPVSSDGSGGFWWRVDDQNGVQSKKVVVPRNAYRAVLEVYASNHGGDEYWYVNPLCSDESQLNQADGLRSAKPNGGFRQVVATIDGRFVGGAIPFPVIYPGSVNPYFWAPVAAIGAYDHPSYDLEITPFLGLLLDGKPHEFSITVKDSQPYWLVSGNLHLWLDHWSDEVEAGLIRYKAPPFKLLRQADWEEDEGKSEIEGQVIVRFSGWVSSSKGNFTTSLRNRIKFKSVVEVEVEEKGHSRTVEVEIKTRTIRKVEKDDEVVARSLVDSETPLQMATMSSNVGGGSRFLKTKLVHKLQEFRSVADGKEEPRSSTLTDRQASQGSVLMSDIGGGSVALGSGNGETKSTYKFRDDKTCYLRRVNMVRGEVKEDVETASCSAAAAS